MKVCFGHQALMEGLGETNSWKKKVVTFEDIKQDKLQCISKVEEGLWLIKPAWISEMSIIQVFM